MLRTVAIIIAALAVLGLVALARFMMRHHAPRPRRRRQPSATAPAPKPDAVPARGEFLKRFDLFAPIIGQVWARRMNRRLWEAAVAATGNAELLQYLRRFGVDSRPWARLLRMWGIEPTDHAAVSGEAEEAEAYVLPDGSALLPGRRYRVLYPAWTLTKRTGQTTEVQLLLRGQAVEITGRHRKE